MFITKTSNFKVCFKTLIKILVISNITKLMDQFALLTGPEFNSFDALRNLSTANDEFLNLFQPVGIYISKKVLTGVEVNF